jgi:two-component system phosphate regulon sensor histidine kinase PhoR
VLLGSIVPLPGFDASAPQIVASRIASRIENHNLIKKTETEKELFDNIIRNISDGVLVVNKSGKIIIWNKFLEDVTGIPSSQVIGHFGIDLALKLGVTDLAHGIIEALKNAKRLKNFYFEKKITTITGEQSWFGFTLSHLIETDGQLGDIVVVVRDISREKELLQAKNDFITTTTHELRTPLTSIKGYLSMLLHGDAGQLTQKQAQYFSKAYISTERLVQLVEDLLVALKIEENKIVLDIQACDINKIINESIENLAAKAAAKNMRIEYKSSPNKYLGMIDPIKTKHVFENLIDNAIKYTKKRGIINITLGKNEDKLVIEIKDNGIGIPKKYLSSIFERFSRIQSPLSVEAGGTGLGLFIVKNYIERQKGKIFVESEPGKGSSFIVELPSVIK